MYKVKQTITSRLVNKTTDGNLRINMGNMRELHVGKDVLLTTNKS